MGETTIGLVRRRLSARGPAWEAEFSAYFAARQHAFTRIAYALLGSWHAAEDAAQQTLCSLYVYWPRIRQGNVDAYARRVLVNNCTSVFRRRQSETTTAEPPDQAHHDDPSIRADLLAALSQLDSKHRVVLTLRFLEDLSVREVAEILRIEEGTVKSQTARGLTKLRTALATYQDLPAAPSEEKTGEHRRPAQQ